MCTLGCATGIRSWRTLLRRCAALAQGKQGGTPGLCAVETIITTLYTRRLLLSWSLRPLSSASHSPLWRRCGGRIRAGSGLGYRLSTLGRL